MSSEVVAESELISFLEVASNRLGLKTKVLQQPRSHRQGDFLSIAVSRSLQGQMVTYPAVAHSNYRGRLLTSSRTPESLDLAAMQLAAMAEIAENNRIGTYLFIFGLDGKLLESGTGLTAESIWSQEFSYTSIFENAIRAAHDLPLGVSDSISSNWMVASFDAPRHLDMERPFLHLFAHEPRYRIQKFGSHTGYVAVSGVENLSEKVRHAVDYLEGVIDE